MSKREFESYEKVHAMLVEAMQEACTKNESGTYKTPDIVPGFIYEKYNSKIKSKSSVSRFSKIAAIFIIILLGLNLISLNTDSGEVYGDKGLLHRIFEGNRGIFTDKDESDVVEFDESGRTFTITDVNEVAEAKKFWPDLYIPEYIPRNYQFKELNVTKNLSGDYFAEYNYIYNEDLLEINIAYSRNENKYYSLNKGSVVELSDRVINVYKDEIYKTNIADIYLEDVFIYIYSSIDKNEILKIAKNIKK